MLLQRDKSVVKRTTEGGGGRERDERERREGRERQRERGTGGRKIGGG